MAQEPAQQHAWTIETHRHDGEIERHLVSASTEQEAREKFERKSAEFIVAVRRARD